MMLSPEMQKLSLFLVRHGISHYSAPGFKIGLGQAQEGLIVYPDDGKHTHGLLVDGSAVGFLEALEGPIEQLPLLSADATHPLVQLVARLRLGDL